MLYYIQSEIEKSNVQTPEIDYEQSFFFLGPSSKTPQTRKWLRAWLKARDGRGTMSRGLDVSEEKERLLAVYYSGDHLPNG